MATVIFKTCDNSFEAELVKGALAASGVPCVLQGGTASIFNAGYGSLSTFPVNVLVDENDLQTAKEIVDAEGQLIRPNV